MWSCSNLQGVGGSNASTIVTVHQHTNAFSTPLAVMKVTRLRATSSQCAKTSSLTAYQCSGCLVRLVTHSPWISRLLQEFGHEVIVANARKVRL